ncbi:MAG: acyl carrier protein [Streptosporangiaceae bacterium]
MASMPDLETVVRSLQSMVDDVTIDEDTSLAIMGVDSLDVLEWLHELEIDYGMALSDESLAAVSPQQSVGEIYRMLTQRNTS